MIIDKFRLDHNQMYWQSMMKYKHGEIQVGTVMIGASHVYFVKTVDISVVHQL